MIAWYNKYINAPHKHLGQDLEKGIDCFNLCCLVLKQECGINVGFSSMDFCNIIDNDWYQKVTESPFEQGSKIHKPDFSWELVEIPKPYDLLLINIGSTNVPNHCAMYVGDNKLLQIMVDRPSWISTYGKYYKQYTLGIYRWNGLKS